MTDQQKRSAALSCVRCDKALENVFNDEGNQPYAGTTFTSYGHYGSTIFDPMDGETFLELNVCDACLRELASKKQILEGRKESRTSFEYKTWEV